MATSDDHPSPASSGAGGPPPAPRPILSSPCYIYSLRPGPATSALRSSATALRRSCAILDASTLTLPLDTQHRTAAQQRGSPVAAVGAVVAPAEMVRGQVLDEPDERLANAGWLTRGGLGLVVVHDSAGLDVGSLESDGMGAGADSALGLGVGVVGPGSCVSALSSRCSLDLLECKTSEAVSECEGLLTTYSWT